jgi:DNA (cytosine-5)-methyltransferase 1
MADPRGALKLTYLDLAARLRPRWVLFEGVPGVRSVDEGRAFGSLVGGLAELGYGVVWTSLDAQYFGVAQRRERVFALGYLGAWQPAASVLFDRSSMRGDPAPSREAGKNPSGTLGSRTSAGGGFGTDFECNGGLVAGTLQASGKAAGSATQQDAEAGLLVAYGGNNTSGPINVATALSAHAVPHGRIDFASETFIAHSLRGVESDASEDGTGRGTTLVVTAFDETQITSRENRSNPQPGAPAPALARGARPPTIAFNARQDPDVSGPVSGPLDTDGCTQAIAFSGKDHGHDAGELSPTLRAMGFDESHANGGGQVAVADSYGVRRLTPRECERLQGFPDDYTLIPYRGRQAADGPRYAALGNSWAVPVVRWIGRRIALVDAALRSRAA